MSVPTINFNTLLSSIQNLSGSGLGFFGAAGFGASVQVGFFQGRTFITNGLGTTQGPEANNVQWLNSASGILGQTGSGMPLTYIPNSQATLNISFTNPIPCKTQAIVLQIFDRTNPNNPASGVSTAVAEIAHPNPVQQAGGSGSTTWVFPAGSGVVLNLTTSPGTSGLRPNGPNTTDTQHDWYVALSASPSTIGSAQYGLYCSLEYL